MVFRIAVIVLGGGFVAYRVALAIQILKARRAGDLARVQHLRRHGFGLYRWAAGAFVILFLLVALIVWANSR